MGGYQPPNLAERVPPGSETFNETRAKLQALKEYIVKKFSVQAELADEVKNTGDFGESDVDETNVDDLCAAHLKLHRHLGDQKHNLDQCVRFVAKAFHDELSANDEEDSEGSEVSRLER